MSQSRPRPLTDEERRRLNHHIARDGEGWHVSPLSIGILDTAPTTRLSDAQRARRDILIAMHDRHEVSLPSRLWDVHGQLVDVEAKLTRAKAGEGGWDLTALEALRSTLVSTLAEIEGAISEVETRDARATPSARDQYVADQANAWRGGDAKRRPARSAAEDLAELPAVDPDETEEEKRKKREEAAKRTADAASAYEQWLQQAWRSK